MTAAQGPGRAALQNGLYACAGQTGLPAKARSRAAVRPHGGGACFKKARLGVRADILCKGKQRFTLGVNGGKDLLFNSIHGFEPPQYGNKGRQKTAPISRSFFIRRTGRGYSDALHWPQAVRNSVHTLVWASMASAEIFWIISMLSALKSSGSVRKDWYASSMSASAAWLVQ